MKSDLAAIKSAHPLADVLMAAGVPLKLRSGRYSACCPFHGEKTPSFYVFDDHYHCFSCGEHGDVIDWMMKAQSLTFKDAVAALESGLASAAPKRQPAIRARMPAETRLTPRECLDLWRACSSATTATMRDRHAAQLGVSVESLTTLGVVWSSQHQGWLWPMRNDAGTMTGLRVRTEAGDKWAVRGSTAGIFLPSTTPAPRVYAVEGGTDCAALLTLGLYAVGRHACLGQEEMLARFLARVGARECVVVADADEPGQRGAEKLLAALSVPACIVTPPAQDVREAVRNGLTAAMVAGLVRSTRFTGGRK